MLETSRLSMATSTLSLNRRLRNRGRCHPGRARSCPTPDDPGTGAQCAGCADPGPLQKPIVDLWGAEESAGDGISPETLRLGHRFTPVPRVGRTASPGA